MQPESSCHLRSDFPFSNSVVFSALLIFAACSLQRDKACPFVVISNDIQSRKKRVCVGIVWFSVENVSLSVVDLAVMKLTVRFSVVEMQNIQG